MNVRTLSITGLMVGLLLFSPAWVRADQKPSQASLGKKIANLTFTDESGKSQKLYDIKNQKAIVLVFLSFECPVSNSYSEPLATLHRTHSKSNVTFVGLTVNQDEQPADVVKQAKHFNIPFPVYLDRNFASADELKADFTPECFVLDGDYVLRYRGRIDNSYLEKLKKNPQVTEHNLSQTLGEILSGRPVSQPATLPIGCNIYREPKVIAKTGKVTYHRDVLPILQKNCQSCHRPGEVGPFSLMNYRQAVNWAEDIKSYTQSRTMPPWKVAEGVSFHNDRRMNDHDIATLAAWVEGGCAEGNPKDAPAPRVFTDGWQLGTPDLVLTVPEEFQLGPTGRDVFRCFVLPTNLPEDTYVTAVEIRPSNARVVHHVLLFIDGTGQGRKLEAAAKEKKTKEPTHGGSELDGGPGYSVTMGVGFAPQGGMGGWAPGQLGRFLPEGSGYFVPKNGDVIMQVHYHRNGRLEKDRSQIGLYFSKKKVTQPFQSGVIAGSSGGIGPFRLFFSIPAGEERYHIGGDSYATKPFTLHTISPHMHMVGKEIRLTMTPPGGKEQTLLAINEWDYNWQETYTLKEPIHVPAGTRFHVDAYYDNSAKNPHNPFNPPRRITFGEQTFNEMCFVFMGGLSKTITRRLPLSPNPPKQAKAAN